MYQARITELRQSLTQAEARKFSAVLMAGASIALAVYLFFRIPSRRWCH